MCIKFHMNVRDNLNFRLKAISSVPQLVIVIAESKFYLLGS